MKYWPIDFIDLFKVLCELRPDAVCDDDLEDPTPDRQPIEQTNDRTGRLITWLGLAAVVAGCVYAYRWRGR